MKFQMIQHVFRTPQDRLYDYRIQLMDYSIQERYHLSQWLISNAVPHTTTGSVIYMRERDAVSFALRWS